jgi:hypothetical protein
MSKQPDKTAPEILTEVGQALFDSPDWQAKLAASLGVGRSTVQYWRNGKMRFEADHPMLDRLLELVSRRAEETARARNELKEWLRRNRK